MEFLLSCSTRNLTSLLRSLGIYRVEHSKRNSTCTCAHVLFCTDIDEFQHLFCFENRISSPRESPYHFSFQTWRHLSSWHRLIKMVVFFQEAFYILLQTLFWLRSAYSSEEKVLLFGAVNSPLNSISFLWKRIFRSFEGALSTCRRLGRSKGVLFE